MKFYVIFCGLFGVAFFWTLFMLKVCSKTSFVMLLWDWQKINY